MPNMLSAAGCLIALLFVLGIWKLFVIRFSTGDIYPAYSTLRADPLGTKVLFDSLRETGLYSVRRNFAPFSQISSGSDLTLLYLGTSEARLGRETRGASKSVDPLDSLVLNGARLVVAFIPDKSSDSQQRTDESQAEDHKPDTENPCSGSDSPQPDDDGAGGERRPTGEACRSDILEQWGVSVVADEMAPKAEDRAAVLSEKPVFAGLPRRLAWHSFLRFEIRKPQWEPVYFFRDRPVIIRRTWGRGEIILLADAFPLSNEAMKTDRAPDLLSWLMGNHETLIFDETHLGMQRNPGIAMLIRENRLHWPLLGMVLTALLFVWKNAVPLVPPLKKEPDKRNGSVSSAKDHTQGLIGLLRRHIPPSRILKTMVEQWQNDLPRNRPVTDDKRRRIHARAGGEKPMKKATVSELRDAYSDIYTIITERVQNGD